MFYAGFLFFFIQKKYKIHKSKGEQFGEQN